MTVSIIFLEKQELRTFLLVFTTNSTGVSLYILHQIQYRQSTQGKTDMETSISRLEEDKASLEKEVSDLKRACEMIEKRAAEQKVADEKNHGEEINFLKRTNQQLKAQLEGIISQKK